MPSAHPPNTIPFPAAPRPTRTLAKIPGYRGLYQYPGRQGYYIRPTIDRRQHTIRLRSTTLPRAEIERGKLLAQIAQYHAGLAPHPLQTAGPVTLRDIARAYLAAGCPKTHTTQPRPRNTLRAEERATRSIIDWPGSARPAADLRAHDWRAYRAWRQKTAPRTPRRRSAGGDSQIDHHRQTVANIYTHAIRAPGSTITANPVTLYRWERFADNAAIQHCRDYMPRSADQLHHLARHLYHRHTLSQVLAWQVLFIARIGSRPCEILRLRMDARDKTTPGHIADGKLYLPRSHTHKGTAGHVTIEPDLAALLAAHRAWHSATYAASPWYFPSPTNPQDPLLPSAIANVLPRACRAADLPPIHAHGLRSFRVNCLRSQGISDAEIALRIGHKTGGKLIVQVYGEGLDTPLTFLPTAAPPAWETFGLPTTPFLSWEI